MQGCLKKCAYTTSCVSFSLLLIIEVTSGIHVIIAKHAGQPKPSLLNASVPPLNAAVTPSKVFQPILSTFIRPRLSS
jgi:hypothetical protein